jgi:hypothetical protein
VVVFTGGRAAQAVTQSNSPFSVPAPGGGSTTDRVQTLVGNVSTFLLSKQDKPAYVSAYVPLTTRSVRLPPPSQIAPRETRLLPGPVTFEWSGSESLRYTVRVFGPEGLLWEQGGLPRQPLTYPSSAPALKPGVRYTWELHTERQPVQRADFELVAAADASRFQQELGLLTPANLPGQSATTIAVLREGLLLRETYLDTARRELLKAIAADTNEPSLHQLLAFVYDRMGAKELAAEEFDEARFLATPRP